MRVRAERGTFPVGAVLGLGLSAAAVLVGLLHLDRLPVTLCMFKAMTGLPCATCGSTRAFAHLVHRDLPGALAMNPLTALGAVVVLLWCAADLLLLPGRRALRLDLSPRETKLLQVVVIVAFLSNWAYVIAAGR